MEDVQSVIKQLTSSNVIQHFQQIWNRAADKFKEELSRPIRRQTLNETKALDKPPGGESGVTIRRRYRGALVAGGRKDMHRSSTRIVHGLLL